MGDQLVRVDRKYQPEDFGFEVEEVDLEFEQLKELEAETKGSDDDDFDTLKGPMLRSEPFTGRSSRGITEQKVQNLLKIVTSGRSPRVSVARFTAVCKGRPKKQFKRHFGKKRRAIGK
jgi:helicase required for RNAi-mediated heterochromatin assembly 1